MEGHQYRKFSSFVILSRNRVPISATALASNACDLNKHKIVEHMAQYGGNPNIFNYYAYKVKFAARRSYDNLKLLNKGKVKKATGTMEHKDLTSLNFSGKL